MTRPLSCAAAADLLSAAVDGELSAGESAELDAHLAACASCRTRQEALQAMSRRARLHVAPAVPDLAGAVVAAAREPAQERTPWSPARTGLVVVGVAMLLLSLPVVASPGVEHGDRHVGITELALAVGVLSAAWRPWRAAGMLPVVVVLSVGLAVVSVVDVVRGAVPLVSEAVHLLPLAGALLLWQLRHRDPIAPRPASGSTALRRSA